MTITLEAATGYDLVLKIIKYFDEYHPAGYGTFVESMGKNEKGEWEAKITRSTSCD